MREYKIREIDCVDFIEYKPLQRRSVLGIKFWIGFTDFEGGFQTFTTYGDAVEFITIQDLKQSNANSQTVAS